MILVVSRWFNEVGYSFRISTKVDGFIRDQVREQILKNYELDKIDEGVYLNLVVATDSRTIDLEVRGPEIRKRQKFIDYGLWLPYDEINRALDPIAKYIEYYFKALRIVFKNYNVPPEAFDSIQEKAEKEILLNPEYDYKQSH